MKGQYRIINEIFLFFIGIFMVSVVAFSMSGVEETVAEVSTKDSLTTVSNVILTGIIKVFESGENSSIVIRMPSYVIDKTYNIKISGDKLMVSLHDDPRVNVTQQIFNISVSKDIIGELTTSSEYMIITNNLTTIEIKRLEKR